MTSNKERAQSPCEAAPESNTQPNSNAADDRAIYFPLTWRSEPDAILIEAAEKAEREHLHRMSEMLRGA
jgi:hypothetical protein